MSRVIELTPASTIRTRRQRWLVKDLVPEGVVTVLAGTGGIGKSTLLSWIVAGVTRGTFEGDMKGVPSSVAFISAEDSLEATLIPRLQVAESDIDRIFDLSSVVVTDEEGVTYRSLPTIADDLRSIRDVLHDSGIKMLVVDPLISISSGDSNKSGDIRRNLDPLAAVAAEIGISIICVVHFRKGGGNASESLSGSHSIRDAAKSVLLLAKDDETEQRILTVDKNNYSPRMPSLAFDIETVSFQTDDGEYAEVGKARLLGDSLVTVHEIMRRAGGDAPLGADQTKLIELVKRHPDGISIKDVAASMGVEDNYARNLLSRAAGRGDIERRERGIYAPLPGNSATGASGASGAKRELAPVAPHAPLAETSRSGARVSLIPGMLSCRVCGEPLPASSAEFGTHPSCDAA